MNSIFKIFGELANFNSFAHFQLNATPKKKLLLLGKKKSKVCEIKTKINIIPSEPFNSAKERNEDKRSLQLLRT
jgi:hypothetical protein